MASCVECLHYNVCYKKPIRNVDTELVMIGDCSDYKPAADVEEVKCRCKDCKYYRSYGRTSLVFEGKNIQCGWCYLRARSDEERRMLPFDFCSYGERRDT